MNKQIQIILLMLFGLAINTGYSQCTGASPNALCRTDTVQIFYDSAGQGIVIPSTLDIGSNSGSGGGCIIDTMLVYQGSIFGAVDTLFQQCPPPTDYVRYDLFVQNNEGNIATCFSIVEFLDTIKPVIVPIDTTLYVDTTGEFMFDTSHVVDFVLEACGDSAWMSDSTVDCSDIGGTVQVTSYIKDIAGNIDSAVSNITVLDTISPTIICNDSVIYLDSFGFAIADTAVLLDTVWDNCQLDSVWTNPETYDCSFVGLDTITIYAMDIYGNIDSCQAEVEVRDTIKPSIICNDTTVYLDTNGQFVIDTSFVLDSYFENCVVDSIWLSDTLLECADIDSTFITIFITDSSGNMDSCQAIVYVIDTLNPIVYCSDTSVILSSLTGEVMIDTSFVLDSIIDNCGVDSVWLSDTTFNCSDIGNNQVRIYVLDNNGNLDSCEMTVVVLDTVAPVLFCNDTTIYLDSSGSIIIDTAFVLDSAIDLCGIDSIWITDSIFDCGRTGTYIINVYARDIGGLVDSCSASVTVLDSIKPSIQCMDTNIYLDSFGRYVIDSSYLVASYFENCQVDSIWVSDTLFTCSEIDTNYVTVYIQDSSGNIDSCISTVVVSDTLNPTVACLDTTIYLDANGEFMIDTSFVFDSAFDACGIDSVWIIDTLMDCSKMGNHSVNVYIRDNNGNIDSCTSMIMVVDSIGPEVYCMDTTIYLDSSGNFVIDTSYVFDSLFDICGVDSVWILDTMFSCTDQGANTVQVYVRDAYGNMDSCSANVTVLDTIATTIICKDTVFYLDTSRVSIIDTSFVLQSYYSNCVDSIWLSDTMFTCNDLDTNDVYIYIRDIDGSIDSCMTKVIINDSLVTSFTCIDTTIYLDSNGQFEIDESFISNSIISCGDSAWIVDSLFDCSRLDSNVVKYYVMDAFSSNVDSCSANVIVIDTIAPKLTCNDSSVYLSPLGLAMIDTSFILSGVFEACVVDSITISDSLFDCSNLDTNIITISAWDNSGNMSSCMVNLIILDSLPPAIACQDSMIYVDSSGIIIIDSSVTLSNSSSQCGIDSVWLSESTFPCPLNGTYTVTTFVRGSNGLTSTCQTMISVIDTIVPVARCKDTTLYLDSTGQMFIDFNYVNDTTYDNCEYGNAYLSQNLFSCADIGTTNITVNYIDIAGNSSTCNSNITIIDTINRTDDLCKDVTGFIGSTGTFDILPLDIYNTNASVVCGFNSIFTSDSSFDCSQVGVNVVTLNFVSALNDTTFCSSNVTVIDSTAPSITSCPVSISSTIYDDCEFIVPNYLSLVSVNENCGNNNLTVTQTPVAGTIIDFSADELSLTKVVDVMILASDNNGNSESCNFTITLDCGSDIIIPEFISPNGDGSNDKWVISYINLFPENTVKIYNRYGTIVYYANGYNNKWNGTNNSGNPLPDGVYFFEVDKGDGTESTVGNVHIMR